MFDAVIFDWDGTLADSEGTIVASFQEVFHSNGISVSNEFIERHIGIGSRKIIIEALKASELSPNDEIVERLLDNQIEGKIKLTSKVRLFPGALEVLNALRDEMKTALATMNNRLVIETILNEKGIRKYFDVVVAAEDVAEPKPDPEIFLKAAAKLACDPEKCVVFEDSVFGVKAAKIAGMKCIAIPSGSYSAEELKIEKPDLMVESMMEKKKILTFVLD